METSRRLPVLAFIAFVLVFLFALGACGDATPDEAAPAAPTSAISGATSPAETLQSESAGSDDLFPTRTPEPTVTPGPLTELVSDVTAVAGLETVEILGLMTDDWLNLVLSILIVLLGYVVGTWLIRRALPRAVRRTSTQFDDVLIRVVGAELRWLAVILSLHFATQRLTFIPTEVKTLLSDAYFVAGLAFVTLIIWRLIDLGDTVTRQMATQQGRLEELAPVITLLVRVGRVVAGLVALIILLGHFGVNVAAFTAALGLGGLAISLAAQDTIADAIAGFIILVDRPFRIGDRIEIEAAGTWGDVMEIGLRTTRIRTRDNRMVIVPNSIIGKNEVINYSYPDPTYRIQTHVGIAYGTDIETARHVILETVRQVEGVLPDKPVDALYIEMGDSAMIFRVRWWIDSYADTRRATDRVHTALQNALDAAGIESPYPTQNLNLRVDPETAQRFSPSLREPGKTPPPS